MEEPVQRAIAERVTRINCPRCGRHCRVIGVPRTGRDGRVWARWIAAERIGLVPAGQPVQHCACGHPLPIRSWDAFGDEVWS